MAWSLTATAEPWVIAHRGASLDAPENTLAAFRLAWDQAADGFECDVRLTADGQVVCIHDETTGRTEGGEKGGGLIVAESSLAQLQKIDVGAWKDERFVGERIPLLSEALATVPVGGRVFIEVKIGPEIVPALMKALAESGLEGEQISVISFDASVIAALRQWPADEQPAALSNILAIPGIADRPVVPGLTLNWLTNFDPHPRTKLPTQSDDAVVQQITDSRADGLGCKALPGRVHQGLVQRLREHGWGFHVWTVDDPAVARYFIELDVDSLTTNRPAALREELGL